MAYSANSQKGNTHSICDEYVPLVTNSILNLRNGSVPDRVVSPARCGMTTHKRTYEEYGRPKLRPPIQRVERHHGEMRHPHEFLDQLRQRLVPEVANIKSLQHAIEDSAPWTGQAFMPAVGSANSNPGDSQRGSSGMTYGRTECVHLSKPNKRKGKKKGGGPANGGPADGGADGVLAAINERMWAYVADPLYRGPLCLDKYGKARRKTVHPFTTCSQRLTICH